MAGMKVQPIFVQKDGRIDMAHLKAKVNQMITCCHYVLNDFDFMLNDFFHFRLMSFQMK